MSTLRISGRTYKETCHKSNQANGPNFWIRQRPFLDSFGRAGRFSVHCTNVCITIDITYVYRVFHIRILTGPAGISGFMSKCPSCDNCIESGDGAATPDDAEDTGGQDTFSRAMRFMDANMLSFLRLQRA
jgi:hypothetical protein